jgi:small subunit ribosomal protein S20
VPSWAQVKGPVDRIGDSRYFFGLGYSIYTFEVLMPNIKSAKKRMELGRTANVRNRANRSQIKTAIRRFSEAEEVETARVHYREAVVLLDRAGTKRLYHPNKVARIKSQLTRRMAEMSEGS